MTAINSLHNKGNILQHLRDRQAGFRTSIEYSNACTSDLSLVQRFQLSKLLKFHTGCVNTLSFNVSGSMLLSGSDDQKIAIWDWMSGSLAGWFDSNHKSNVFQARFIPFTSDRMIVTSGLDGAVRIAELDPTGVIRHTKRITKHNGPCHKLIISIENPNCIISCGEDGCIKLTDVRMRKSWKAVTVVNHQTHKIPLYSICARPYTINEFAACGMDQWLRIYDYRFTRPSNGQFVKRFCPHAIQSSLSARSASSHVTAVMYSPNGKEVIGSYHNNKIYMFNVDHSDQADSIHEYTGHRNYDTVKGVNFYGHNGEYIISGSDCGNVFIWDKDSEKIIWYDRADHSGAVNVIEIHPTYPIFATSGYDAPVKIWEPTRPKPVTLRHLREIVANNNVGPDFDNQFELLVRMVRPVGRIFIMDRRVSSLPPSPNQTNDEAQSVSSATEVQPSRRDNSTQSVYTSDLIYFGGNRRSFVESSEESDSDRPYDSSIDDMMLLSTNEDNDISEQMSSSSDLSLSLSSTESTNDSSDYD